MHVRLHNALVLVVAVLPAGKLKNALLRRLGWAIGDGAHIGPSLVLNVGRVEIGDDAWIGSFNVLKDLAALTLEASAIIGNWNWVTAAVPLREAGAPCLLHLGAHSAITSRHYLTCSGGIRVGKYTSIGGVRSTFISHQISWKSSDQTCRPIEIGEYCLITSNVKIAPGTVIGDRVVVGMGATIAGKLLEPGLYVQPRATLVKADLDGEYFRRTEGRVWTFLVPNSA
jgi:acetyltransferase-like isoleucine patch superfamily enzyme